jgi:hypothetical protein
VPPILDRKLRFGDAVFAIDATPKTLRNWLNRNQVRLPSGAEAASGWRVFSPADIAVLAVVRKLVEFGVPVEEASRIANAAFARIAGMLLTYRNTPVPALIGAFNDRILCVWRDPPGGPWHWNLMEGSAGDVDALLMVILAPVIARALNRAAEANSEGEFGADDDAAPNDAEA